MARLDRGRRLTRQKDFPGAIAALDEALELIADHPRALSARGYARLLSGTLDEAEVDLRRALDRPMKPKLEAAIAYNLGLVEERRGRPNDALRHFERSMALRATKAARKKLAAAKRLAACAHVADSRSVKATEYAGWLELWKAMAERMAAADPEAKSPPAPGADPAARLSLCWIQGEDRCKGEPPWLVAIPDEESLEHSPRFFAVVTRAADRLLASDLISTVLMEGSEGACGTSLSIVRSPWVHATIVQFCQEYSFDCEDDQELVMCDKDFFTDADRYDYVFEVGTLEQRLALDRPGHAKDWDVDDDDLEYEIELEVREDEITLSGPDCNVAISSKAGGRPE